MPKQLKGKKAAFPHQLYFVTAKVNTPEIVINADKERTLKEFAK